jgi:hypothetical protein
MTIVSASIIVLINPCRFAKVLYSEGSQVLLEKTHAQADRIQLVGKTVTNYCAVNEVSPVIIAPLTWVSTAECIHTCRSL